MEDMVDMEAINFVRQNKIFNPENQSLNISIIGCGSIGSFTALTLAKMGFKNIKVIDFDKVESHNIPNQFYRIKDIGKPKLIALQEIVKEFTGIKIKILNKEIKKDFEFNDLDLNSIIVLCVDNMKTRKLIYNKIKDIPIMLLDSRMGGEGYQIYSIDLSDDDEKKYYEERLKAKSKDTTCGEKAIIYTILSLSSELCNIIKKIDKEEDYPKVLKRELKTYTILNN